MSATLGHPRPRNGDHGFTLIELMVVVLIIAILMAIAIPTFLGAKARSQDKATQSSLRNAITNAKVIYNHTDVTTYSGATPTALGAAEPSMAFLPASTTSTQSKEISVNAQGTYIVLAARSSTQTCFVIADWETSGTFFAKVTGDCSSAAAATALNATATAPTAPSPASNSTTSAPNAWVASW